MWHCDISHVGRSWCKGRLVREAWQDLLCPRQDRWCPRGRNDLLRFLCYRRRTGRISHVTRTLFSVVRAKSCTPRADYNTGECGGFSSRGIDAHAANVWMGVWGSGPSPAWMAYPTGTSIYDAPYLYYIWHMRPMSYNVVCVVQMVFWMIINSEVWVIIERSYVLFSVQCVTVLQSLQFNVLLLWSCLCELSGRHKCKTLGYRTLLSSFSSLFSRTLGPNGDWSMFFWENFGCRVGGKEGRREC